MYLTNFVDTVRLPVADGFLHGLVHAPAGPCREALVYLHPFGDELNKSRHVVSLQAKALAALGVAVLQIDLHGCGNSSASAGASWEQWLRDVDTARAWLAERFAVPVGLWGLRLGALLALDHAARAAHTPARLLLWQPVTSGDAFLTHFLRMRIAADLKQEGSVSGGIAALRDYLEQGRPVEVDGHEMTPALAAAIAPLDPSVLAPRVCRIDWFEVTQKTGHELPAMARRIAATWQAQGIDFAMHGVPGTPFWSSPVTDDCAALVEATNKAVGSGRAIS